MIPDILRREFYALSEYAGRYEQKPRERPEAERGSVSELRRKPKRVPSR